MNGPRIEKAFVPSSSNTTCSNIASSFPIQGDSSKANALIEVYLHTIRFHFETLFSYMSLFVSLKAMRLRQKLSPFSNTSSSFLFGTSIYFCSDGQPCFLNRFVRCYGLVNAGEQLSFHYITTLCEILLLQSILVRKGYLFAVDADLTSWLPFLMPFSVKVPSLLRIALEFSPLPPSNLPTREDEGTQMPILFKQLPGQS